MGALYKALQRFDLDTLSNRQKVEKLFTSLTKAISLIADIISTDK